MQSYQLFSFFELTLWVNDSEVRWGSSGLKIISKPASTYSDSRMMAEIADEAQVCGDMECSLTLSYRVQIVVGYQSRRWCGVWHKVAVRRELGKCLTFMFKDTK